VWCYFGLRVCASYANFAQEINQRAKADNAMAKAEAKAAKEEQKAALQATKLAISKKKKATDAIDLLKDAVPQFQVFMRSIDSGDCYAKQSCGLLLERASGMFRQATDAALDASGDAPFGHDVKAVRQVIAEMASKQRTRLTIDSV
jgi:hypothetical protein